MTLPSPTPNARPSSDIPSIPLLKERKNVGIYGEQPAYAKGHDCDPAEHRRVRHNPDLSWLLSRDSHRLKTRREAAKQIGKWLFAMNAAAIKARYGTLPQRPAVKFADWADGTRVEQFKAMRCLLYQACEGAVPNGRLYRELNRVAGELAQRIVQDSPEYEKAPWG